MNVLVFGATGQVACALQRIAPQATYLSRGQADLADPAACAAAIHHARPAAVINAAAYTAVDKAESEEPLATTINGAAPGAMAVACAELDIPLVHISTDYVFDGQGTRAWHPQDDTAPLGAYGRSKLAGEALITASGARASILRTSWVFSQNGNNFVKTMLRLSQTHPSLKVVADQIGGPTPASGIAQAVLRIAQAMQQGQDGGIYHYAGAPAVSWADFARAIFDIAQREVGVTDIPGADYPTPAMRPPNSRMDCTSLETDFGIPPADWRKALTDVIKEIAP